MSTELATLDLSQLPSTQLGSDESFVDLSKGGDYLKCIKLYSKGKDIDKGKIPPGRWGIPESEDEIIDLGDSIDVLPLARRPKALDMSDKTAVVVSYDEKSAVFKDIQARSAEKESSCLHGISFLVLERSTGRFSEVFFGNKSSRPEAKKIFPYLPVSQSDIDRKEAAGNDMSGAVPRGPLPVTLKIRLAESRGFSWHCPMVVKCSAPIKTPATAVIVREINKFLTIKSGGVEKVQEPEGRKARAR